MNTVCHCYISCTGYQWTKFEVACLVHQSLFGQAPVCNLLDSEYKNYDCWTVIFIHCCLPMPIVCSHTHNSSYSDWQTWVSQLLDHVHVTGCLSSYDNGLWIVQTATEADFHFQSPGAQYSLTVFVVVHNSWKFTYCVFVYCIFWPMIG